MNKLYIRKSMLESYEFCPQQFFKQFIEMRQITPNQKMLIGTRFHEWVDKFFDYAVAFDPLDWYEFIPFEDLNEEELEMYEWFLEYQQQRWVELAREDRLKEFPPLYKELYMRCDRIQLHSTVDGAFWVSAYDKTVELVEYKTGAKPNEDSAVRQLAFYATLWSESGLPGKVVNLKLINPRLELVMNWEYTDQLKEAAERRVDQLRNAINSNMFPYKCTEGKFSACKLCSMDELPRIFPDSGMKKFADVYDIAPKGIEDQTVFDDD